MKNNFSIGNKATVLIIRFIMLVLLVVFMLYGSVNHTSVFLKPILLLIGIHFFSQLIVLFLKERFLLKPYIQMTIFVFDVAVLSAAIYLTQGFNQDLYLIYFLTIFMASMAKSTFQALLASFISALFYIVVTFFITGLPEKMEPIILLRIPFLFLTALSTHYFAAKLGRKNEELEGLEQSGKTFENRIMKLLETMTDGTIITDDDFNIIKMNHEAEKYFNIKNENALGRNIAEVTHGFTPETPWKDLKNKKMQIIRFDLRREDREPRHLIVLLSKAAESKKKTLISQIMIIKNASQIKQNEEFQRDFLQTVSKSYNQQISPLLKYTEYISNDPANFSKIDDNTKGLLHSIRDKALILSNISDKLSRFSSIEAGSLNIKREDITFTQLINDAVQHLKNLPGLSEQGSLKLNIDDSLNKIPPLNIDRDSITEALINILENAVKYNTKQEKEVWIRGNSANMASANQVEIEISDNGSGILPEMQGRLFNRPITYKKDDTEKMHGTGIGLLICKKLIELNSGKIRFESVTGQGTKFTLTLPLSLAMGKHINS